MAKASEQMEKALKVSECVPEIGTELHRERLLSKLLDESSTAASPTHPLTQQSEAWRSTSSGRSGLPASPTPTAGPPTTEGSKI